MIKISSLSKTTKDFSYKDILLDFQESKVSLNSKNNDIVAGNDIVVSTDINAIKNSIVNILTQTRYTNSLMNVNLKKYLGSPATEMTSQSIGNDIDKGLALLEPRIKVNNILIAPDFDQFTYRIVIIYSIKALGLSKEILEGTLNSTGRFAVINN